MSIATRIDDKRFVKHTGLKWEAPCPKCGEIFTLTDKQYRGEDGFDCWVEGCGFNEKIDFRMSKKTTKT